MTTNTEGLKPCICGKIPKLVDLAGWEITCNCGVNFCIDSPVKFDVVTAWNHRPTAQASETIRNAALRDAISALENERLIDATGMSDDIAYGLAIDHGIAAIRALSTMPVEPVTSDTIQELHKHLDGCMVPDKDECGIAYDTWGRVCKLVEMAQIALLKAAPDDAIRPVVQDAPSAITGWKLVPIDPTDAMLSAGARSIINGQENRPGTSWAEESGMAYAAMLNAAPHSQ